MYRSFNLTLPADTNAHNLWDLIVAAGFCDQLGNMLVSSVKNDAIVPNKVQQLTITVRTGSIAISDNSGAAGGGVTYTAGSSMTWRNNLNTIYLKDRVLTGAAGSETFTVDMESY